MPIGRPGIVDPSFGPVPLVSAERPRHPEIQHLHLTVRPHEDVPRLDVSVDDARAVRGVERLGDLGRDLEHLARFERLAGDVSLEIRALQPLHGDERLAVVVLDLVDGADVGMVQPRQRVRLATEPPDGVRVADELIREELEGDPTGEPLVLGVVDDTHSADPEPPGDAVVRDSGANQNLKLFRSAVRNLPVQRYIPVSKPNRKRPNQC